jgi:hypothetical protein
MATIGILLAALVDSAAGHSFHSEDRLVKIGHGAVIMSVHR